MNFKSAFFLTSLLSASCAFSADSPTNKTTDAKLADSKPTETKPAETPNLSTQAADGKPAINARDRIGNGPWFNAKGAVVAKDVADLHGDTLEAARRGNNLSRTTAITEKKESIKGAGDTPNQHDIITGSQLDGTAFAVGADHTCKNYTSNADDGSVQLGHFDRTGGGNTSWNSAHASKGCSQEKLVSTGGAGLLYCFSTN